MTGMQEDILLREDRLTYSISDHELERRWKAVRKKMETAGIDYLVTQSQQRFSCGYLRWFTDICPSSYHTTMVFPPEGEMTIIAHGPKPPSAPRGPDKWALRGVGKLYNVPSTPSIPWQDDWHAEKVAEVVKRETKKTIGLVGLGNISGALTEGLRKELPAAKLVNATNLVDEVKMIKSEEELKLLKIAAQIHADCYEEAKRAVRPGRLAIEAIDDIRKVQMMQRGEEGQIFIWFGPPGLPRLSQQSWGNSFVRRPLTKGDAVDILIEVTGPGGYWYDLRRMMFIGTPPQELRYAHAISKEALKIVAGECKPGATPGSAMKANNDFLREKGCPEEYRILGHGQGSDMVERPMIDPGEPAKIEEGMVLALHPSAAVRGSVVSISDDFLVTPKGCVPLDTRLAEDDEIFEIG